MAPLHLYQLPSISYIAPLLIISLVVWKAYHAIRGPLSHIPGPRWSQWTRIPLKLAVLKGERVQYVHSLHERHGPIVRIAPGEVSLADVSAAREIYKVGGRFQKSDWYDTFTGNTPHRNLFTMVDPKQHGIHRRLTAFNFSEKWVDSYLQPFIARNTRLAIDRMMEEDRTTGYVDVFKWFMFMATDVIGEASFGDSFRMLETGKRNQYIEDLEMIGSRSIYRTEFLLLAKIMYYSPVGPAREINRAIGRLRQYSKDSVQRYWTQLRADPDNVKPTMLTKEFAAVENGTITEGQVERDAQGNIVAGTDTTAIAATYAVWRLGNNPEIQEALIREVSALPADFTDHDLRQLKLLNGVINETLRLHSPVGQGLPRLVPEKGAFLAGYFVPENLVVGVQAYSMHRDPNMWSDPFEFRPDRWLEPSHDMYSFLPFGGGSHVCIGSHFAQLELRHALANFCRTFGESGGIKVAHVEGFGEQDMLQTSFFLSPPKGKRCLVQRRKRSF